MFDSISSKQNKMRYSIQPVPAALSEALRTLSTVEANDGWRALCKTLPNRFYRNASNPIERRVPNP